jgi:hypothetical protein
MPALSTGSDEGDAKLLIGPENGTRQDLNTGEGSGLAEEVTTVDH